MNLIAYRNSNDLKLIVERVLDHTLEEHLKEDKKKASKKLKEKSSSMESGIGLMHPVKPMLARLAISFDRFLLTFFFRQCGSPEEVCSRCPNGLCAEIKYDGERLQVIIQEGGKNTCNSQKYF